MILHPHLHLRPSPHPATTPLPPRAPVRYRPRMHNARARHHDIQHTVRMNRIAASACSSRMTTCGLDRNQQDLFPHHARLNLGIVAAMRHNSYRSITKTYDPQLRRGYPNIPSAATAGPENNPRCAVLLGNANGDSPDRGGEASVSLGRREDAHYASVTGSTSTVHVGGMGSVESSLPLAHPA